MILVSVIYFSCFGNLEREIAKGVGAGSLGRDSHAFSSEKSGMKPLKEAVEQADELEDQAIMVELDGPEEETAEDEAEDPESEGKKTIAAVAEGSWRNFSLLPLNRLRNNIS